MDAISVEQLERLVEDGTFYYRLPYEFKNCHGSLLAFAAFLRFDELISVRVLYICLFFLLNHQKQIARSSKNTCPVKMLSGFFDLCGFTKSSDDHSFLFRSLSKTRKGYKVRSANNKISYSRM